MTRYGVAELYLVTVGVLAGTTACVLRPPVVTQPAHISVDQHALGIAPQRLVTWDTDFWHATTSVNFPVAWATAKTSAERQLIDGFQAMTEGRWDAADHAIVPLLRARDTLVAEAARDAYDVLLSVRSEWGQLAAYADSAGVIPAHSNAAEPSPRPTAQIASHDLAGIERWAGAFRGGRPRAEFTDSVGTIPLVRTGTGIPTVTVFINGTPKRFWLDTGSSISILTAPVAATCGVSPRSTDTLELLTSIGRLPARPAIIASVHLATLALSDVPAMIVDTTALALRVGENTDSKSLPIDGIIGFDVIRQLDLTIDDVRGRVTVRRPVLRHSHGRAPRNLFWFGVPIVTLLSEHGLPLHLALDTGADETYGTQGLVTKTGTSPILAERRGISGFGGSTSVRGVVIPRLRLYLDDVPLLFERVFLYKAQYPTIFELDGTLGADVIHGAIIRIDVTNGRFEVGQG